MSRHILAIALVGGVLAAPQPLRPDQMDKVTAGGLLIPEAVAIGSASAVSAGVQVNTATAVTLTTDTTGSVVPGYSYSSSQSAGIATAVGK
jgi:hypothetical protein